MTKKELLKKALKDLDEMTDQDYIDFFESNGIKVKSYTPGKSGSFIMQEEEFFSFEASIISEKSITISEWADYNHFNMGEDDAA